MVARICASYESDPELARELAQDVFLAVWRALPSFRGESSTRTFVARIAQFRAVSHVAARVRVPARYRPRRHRGDRARAAARRAGDRREPARAPARGRPAAAHHLPRPRDPHARGLHAGGDRRRARGARQRRLDSSHPGAHAAARLAAGGIMTPSTDDWGALKSAWRATPPPQLDVASLRASVRWRTALSWGYLAIEVAVRPAPGGPGSRTVADGAAWRRGCTGAADGGLGRRQRVGAPSGAAAVGPDRARDGRPGDRAGAPGHAVRDRHVPDDRRIRGLRGRDVRLRHRRLGRGVPGSGTGAHRPRRVRHSVRRRPRSTTAAPWPAGIACAGCGR